MQSLASKSGLRGSANNYRLSKTTELRPLDEDEAPSSLDKPSASGQPGATAQEGKKRKKRKSSGSLYAEAKKKRALVLHHESSHRSRMEFSQLEFELKEQVWQKDMYRVLSEHKDEVLKDLPILLAELEKAQREALSVKWKYAKLLEKIRIFEIKNKRLHVMTNDANSQVQEKIDLIDQLWAGMNELKTSAETLRSRMDLLASEKKATK
ncbi:uncharacterized protein [Nicotiana tomentosiformis]|uniref:uncharacterized protein n=1 Tax=Nicotiana tomentosiformis TaxID=4098 RepID=UPI00388C4331